MMMRISAAFAVLVSFSSVPAFAAPSIVEFDPQGSIETLIPLNSIDKKGNIIGTYCCDDGVNPGFIRHPDGTYTTVGPNGYDVYPRGLAKGGLVTGEYAEGHAFVGDSKGHVTTFDAPGASVTSLADIAANGTAVGYFVSADGLWHGFTRDKDGNFTMFDAPKAGTDGTGENEGTFVSASNDDGEIVGWSVDDSGGFHAFLRSPNGKFKLLRLPQGALRSSHAYCINKKGTIGGYYYDVNNAIHGFLRDHKGNVTIVDIDDATYVQVSGVNNKGDATGIYYGADGFRHGFVRSASGDVEKFDAPDADGTRGGTYAQSINDNGVVAGYYWDSRGFAHGFVRTP